MSEICTKTQEIMQKNSQYPNIFFENSLASWILKYQNFFNPYPRNDTFWHPWVKSLSKTVWEKEKLLVTSNFSFSHSVLYLFE